MGSIVRACHQHPGAFVKRPSPSKADSWLTSKCNRQVAWSGHAMSTTVHLPQDCDQARLISGMLASPASKSGLASSTLVLSLQDCDQVRLVLGMLADVNGQHGLGMS